MSAIKKLTPKLLKKLVLEEKKNIESLAKVTAAEVDASDYAGTLSKKIDYIKALKIEETKIRKRLQRIKKIKEAASTSLIKDIK